jgi:S1-C subfamily serine protease
VKRSITEPNGIAISDLIQTDAAINPGNSGGPLLNLNGEMIGINTAGATGTADEPAQNIGFALSINSVRPIIDAFMSGKQVSRPYIGVSLTNVTPAVATRYGLKVNSGVLITQVGPNTPAAQAKFTAGDTIVEMDGTKINETADLSTVLSRHKPGDTVSVTLVNRNGQQRTAQLTLGQAPASS